MSDQNQPNQKTKNQHPSNRQASQNREIKMATMSTAQILKSQPKSHSKDAQRDPIGEQKENGKSKKDSVEEERVCSKNISVLSVYVLSVQNYPAMLLWHSLCIVMT